MELTKGAFVPVLHYLNIMIWSHIGVEEQLHLFFTSAADEGWLKDRIKEPEETTAVNQRLSKHPSAATSATVAIEELLKTMISRLWEWCVCEGASECPLESPPAEWGWQIADRPFLLLKRRRHFKTRKRLIQNESMSMIPTAPETEIHCAGKGHQQVCRLT
jgi:hypothetical protein